MIVSITLLLAACGGDASGPGGAEPVTCVQAAPGLCNNAGCVNFKACDGEPDFGEAVVCEFTGDSGNESYPMAYTCRWSS